MIEHLNALELSVAMPLASAAVRFVDGLVDYAGSVSVT
jgi:hypothetical protein